jgi:hypothetical protein
MRTLLMIAISVPLLLGAGRAAAIACSELPAAQPLPVRTTPVPPLAAGLTGRPSSVASPHVLLTESRDEALALDVVLLRLRQEGCVKDEFASYKPKTQFDNTPWRFNMEKGKRFDAAQFDAWMKSRGVRVATGKPGGASAPAAAPTATPPPAPAPAVVND